MAAPDARMRFPAGLIDFTADVGIASQDHDNYPPPQGQARFDHMRMAVIALLSQQASFSEPTQYRDGTPWFDLNDQTLKIRRSNEWVRFSEAIPLGESEAGVHLTLEEWFASTNVALSSLTQEVVFNGTSTANSVTDITIPSSLQVFLFNDTQCFFYLNGLLLDPRNCSLIGSPPTTVRLSNTSLSIGDTFTVIMRRVPSSSFHVPTVSVP